MSAAPLVRPHWCDEVEVATYRDETTTFMRSRPRRVEGELLDTAAGRLLGEPASVFVEQVHYDWDGDDASAAAEPDEQPMVALVLKQGTGPWKMSAHTAQVLAEELLNAAALLGTDFQ